MEHEVGGQRADLGLWISDWGLLKGARNRAPGSRKVVEIVKIVEDFTAVHRDRGPV